MHLSVFQSFMAVGVVNKCLNVCPSPSQIHVHAGVHAAGVCFSMSVVRPLYVAACGSLSVCSQ